LDLEQSTNERQEPNAMAAAWLKGRDPTLCPRTLFCWLVPQLLMLRNDGKNVVQEMEKRLYRCLL